MKKLHTASYLVSGLISKGQTFAKLAHEALDEFLHDDAEPGEVYNASNGLVVSAVIIHEDDIEIGARQ